MTPANAKLLALDLASYERAHCQATRERNSGGPRSRNKGEASCGLHRTIQKVAKKLYDNGYDRRGMSRQTLVQRFRRSLNLFFSLSARR